MSNFRFIEMNVDVSKILNQLHSRPDDWNYVRDLQGAGVDGDVDPYGFLPLTMALVDPGEDPKNAEKTENTPLYKAHSETRKWLRGQGIMQTSRAAFFKLEPGDSVGRHIDEGTYYRTRDRYHLSLEGEYEYTVGDEMHIIKPGTFFWFDNDKHHEAYNCGNVDRLTFVFDVPKSDKNP